MSLIRKLNINEAVRIKLTSAGLKRLRKHHEERFGDLLTHLPYEEPKVDEKGWTSMQLWKIMQEFGPVISMAGPLYFEMTIEIDA